VMIGESVCSKRTPFYADRIPAAIERLQRGGKKVILSSLAMVTLEREKRAARELFDQASLEVELNDLTLMNWAKSGTAFSIGPLVNVYNEATLAFLARQGARPILPAAGAAFRFHRGIGGSRRRMRRRDRALGLWTHSARHFGPLLSTRGCMG